MPKGTLPDSATQSTLGRAVETDDPDIIATLDRSELVFYVCAKLGIEPPAEHPAEFSGRVSRELLQEITSAMADEEND